MIPEQLAWIDHQLELQGVCRWKRDAIRSILEIDDEPLSLAALTNAAECGPLAIERWQDRIAAL